MVKTVFFDTFTILICNSLKFIARNNCKFSVIFLELVAEY